MDMRHRFIAFVFPVLAVGQLTAQATAMSFSADQGAAVISAISTPLATIMVSTDETKAAQAMVAKMGDEAIATIANASLDEAAKKQVFKRILTQNFDMGTIGRFAMGRFWRVATPAQQQAYNGLYEKMIIDVYTARFNKYSGQSFDVTESRLDPSGDIVVRSKIISKNSAPVSVDWRVRSKGGSYRVIDVMVEGVSMAVTQRNDFAGIIQQGGGTVDALLDYLKKGGTSDAK